MRRFRNRNSGFTLIETLIGVVILGIIVVSIYRAFTAVLQILQVSEVRVAAATLANERMEFIRNMGYSDIGTVGGAPPGFVEPVETKKKRGIDFTVTTSVRNVDDPFDGTIGGNPNDLSPADYKLIDIIVQCALACSDPRAFEFTARAAPKALETASTMGSLFAQVIDASGLPVSGATVHITNPTVSPAINITDVTDTTGFLKIIDLPPSAQSYHIAVSKSGYSQDQTYAPSLSNPNPVKPDATVALQTLTQVTFPIDRVSTMNMASITEACGVVPNINFTLTGAKLIGTQPNIPKFSQSFATDGAGLRTVSNAEWDNYSLSVPVSAYALRGVIPLTPFVVVPNSTQDVKMVLEPQNPQSLLVTVEDSVTGLPISSASVTLTAAGYQNTLVTGRGFLRQTDWSGGGGQDFFVNAAQYFSQDGNVETGSPAGEIKLISVTPGIYPGSGVLTSSTFDTGAISNFYTLTFNPTSPPPQTGLDAARMQIATATTTQPATWTYLGPDGTANTYYTASNTNVNPIHNGDRYLRYQVYLQTANPAFTPSVSEVAITFGSSCVPPGQVFFGGLSPDTYSISVQRTGYQTYNDIVTVNQPWQEFIVSLISQ